MKKTFKLLSILGLALSAQSALSVTLTYEFVENGTGFPAVMDYVSSFTKHAFEEHDPIEDTNAYSNEELPLNPILISMSPTSIPGQYNVSIDDALWFSNLNGSFTLTFRSPGNCEVSHNVNVLGAPPSTILSVAVDTGYCKTTGQWKSAEIDYDNGDVVESETNWSSASSQEKADAAGEILNYFGISPSELCVSSANFCTGGKVCLPDGLLNESNGASHFQKIKAIFTSKYWYRIKITDKRYAVSFKAASCGCYTPTTKKAKKQ